MSAAEIARIGRIGVYERPSLARLTLVELRKMVDTLSGVWLLLGTTLVTAGVVALFCIFAKPQEIDLASTLEVAVAPASILLPILGVLLVTSEWSQRTAMITFTLVPQRGRVFAAKLLAGALLALASMAVSLPAAAVGTALAAPDTHHTWSLSPELLGRMTLSVAISMFFGIGFGAVLLSTPAAIVVNFALPPVWGGLGAIPALDGVATWLDPTRTLTPLTAETMSGSQWAHTGASLAVWLVVPLALGFRRILRADVR